MCLKHIIGICIYNLFLFSMLFTGSLCTKPCYDIISITYICTFILRDIMYLYALTPQTKNETDFREKIFLLIFNKKKYIVLTVRITVSTFLLMQ